MNKIVVLGAGLVGKAIAIDLSQSAEVTSVDYNAAALTTLSGYRIKTVQMDLADRSKLMALVKDFDLVIGAVPGFMGFETVRTVIEA